MPWAMEPFAESRARLFSYVRMIKIFQKILHFFGMTFESALISIILILELSVFCKCCLKLIPESRARPFSYVRVLCAQPIFFHISANIDRRIKFFLGKLFKIVFNVECEYQL